ncbi:MAG: response regulator [Bacteroidia bacterium]|nr:response regulator [Bacteroidia bacterium]
MAIRVLIVEDEMLIAEDIATDLMEYGFEVAETLISGEECLKKFEQLNPDVVIMDIHIKGKYDGIETAKLLNNIKKTPIVYLTANSDQQTVKRVLDIFPATFISKPYNKNDLMIAIEVAYNLQHLKKYSEENQPLQETIFIKSGNHYKKINLMDILFLEADGSYSKIFTKTEELLVSYNLSHFEEIVQHPAFKRIHRSYIVNINYVDGLDSNAVIVNNKQLPVSKQYLKEVMALFKKL